MKNSLGLRRIGSQEVAVGPGRVGKTVFLDDCFL